MRGFIALFTVFGFGCKAALDAKTNAVPTANITSHEDGDTARQGGAETLRGQVADSDHSHDELEVAWVVGGIDVCPDSAPDEDGLVECETIFGLGEGSGLVSLTVRDSHWQQGWAQVTLDVQANNAPMANIQEPTADGIYYSDNHTNLWGTVSDTEDAVDTLTVQWHSSVDGVLEGDFSLIPDSGGGLTAPVILSEGEHTITLTVTDSMGEEARENVTINVGSANTAPTCVITGPASGSVGVEGEEVTFSATVADVNIPAERLAVYWQSDFDGALGYTPPNSAGDVSFPLDSLTINTHTITMTVEDEHGLNCTANVTYTVTRYSDSAIVGPHGGTMVKIDAQTFEMGCTDGMSSCESDEYPAHDVTLTDDFYIGETEVTQGEYEAMMGTDPSYFSDCGSNCPVEQVSWHMSAAFANAVSDSEGLEQCYTCTGAGSITSCSVAVEPYRCDGYRLPTEAEWEAAARCGEDTLYAGLAVLDDVAWYYDTSIATTHSVATKLANACGLYDMSGNVQEWTQDWYSLTYYGSTPTDDPPGAIGGSQRVHRGGGWSGSATNMRVSWRNSSNPMWNLDNVGFRLSRTSP